ncbi:MAG TPA: ComEC/Rec2 family competence protein [Candidatus Nitrosotenuis sp.]|nr:ComEC/Rec2 family competence protein [Candidatus Nitrosotenuis sp.]
MHRWPAPALLGLAAGILLSFQAGSAALALTLLALCGAALLVPELRAALVLAGLFCLVGYGRAEVHQVLAAQDPLQGLEGQVLRVQGTVTESPRRRGRGLAFLLLLSQPTSATVLAEVYGGALPQVAAGERWELRGRLRPLRGARYPGGFDEAAWLGREGVHHRFSVEVARRLGPPQGWTPQALAWTFRQWLIDGVERSLPPDPAGLLVGLTLGDTSGLSRQVTEDFRTLGASHLLAASGLNVALVAGMVAGVGRLAGWSRRRTALLALAAVAFYALLAGGSPSVVRAAAMAALALLALALGRRTDVLHCLLLACLGILILRPQWLYDIGFQLSVAALVGLLALAPGLARKMERLPRWLRLNLAVSAAATLATAPLLAWHFQQAPPLSLLANLLMVPPAELLVPLGLAAACVAAWSPWLATPFMALCRILLQYLLGLSSWLASLSPGGAVARPSEAVMGAAFLGLVLLHLGLEGKGSRSARVGLAAAVAALLGWGLTPPAPSGLLEVRLADLRAGAAAWVTTPGGKDLLLLESEEAREEGLAMLRAQGLGGADGLLVVGQAAGSQTLEPEVAVEAGSGWLILRYREFSLLWSTSGELPPGGARVALVPRRAEPARVLPALEPLLLVWPGGPPRRAWRQAGGAAWVMGERGPLELRSDGHWLRWGPWR